MKISVVIPTYCPGAYIWDCLESLYLQSLCKNEYEVIIVLNGCKNPYYDELKNWLYKHNDMRFVLMQTDVSGVSNARNIAMESASGEYLTFVDDDDYVSNSYLETLLKFASKETVSLSYTFFFYDGASREIENSLKDEYNNTPKRLLKITSARRYFSGPCMKLIHKDIIAKRKYDSRFTNGEDSLFMFLISDRIKNVVFVDKHAIYYRRLRQGSAVSHSKPLTWNRTRYNSLQFCLYIKYYLKNPLGYNLFFFLQRLFLCVYTLFR